MAEYLRKYEKEYRREDIKIEREGTECGSRRKAKDVPFYSTYNSRENSMKGTKKATNQEENSDIHVSMAESNPDYKTEVNYDDKLQHLTMSEKNASADFDERKKLKQEMARQLKKEFGDVLQFQDDKKDESLEKR